MAYEDLLSQLAKEHGGLQARCEALTAENAALKAQLEQLREHEGLQARCEALAAENAALKAQLGQLPGPGADAGPIQSAWAREAEPPARDREGPRRGGPARSFLADAAHAAAPEERLEAEARAQEQKDEGMFTALKKRITVRFSPDMDEKPVQPQMSIQCTLHPHFQLKDEELVLLQPASPALDSADSQAIQMLRSGSRKPRIRTNQDKCDVVSFRAVLHPESNVQVAWDVASMCMVAYDVTMTPVLFILTGSPVRVLEVCDWVVNGFWTADIAITFRTGFQVEGNEVEMRPWLIAKHYARTWLIFDILVVLPDYVAAIVSVESRAQISLSMIRFIRFFRLLRLLRVIKLKRLVTPMVWRINSNKVLGLLKVLCLVLVAGLISHIIACGWYAVGDDTYGWVSRNDLQGMPPRQRYLLSLYWALSQLQGSTEIQPQTVSELVFVIATFPVTLTVTAAFISYITTMLLGSATLANSTGLNSYRETLRNYLTRHRVSRRISVRVKKFVEEEAYSRHMRREEQKILELIPTALIRDMMFDVRGECVVKLPVFNFLKDKHPRFMRHLCTEAIATEHVVKGERLFEEGDACGHMRFVQKGSLSYRHREGRCYTTDTAGSSACQSNDGGEDVREGALISEACLWTVWENCGQLVSKKDGVLFALDALKFGRLVTLYRHVQWSLVHYARHFIVSVNKMEFSDLLPPIQNDQWNAEYVEVRPVASTELPWSQELPAHLSRTVCEVCVKMAQRIARDGLDENRPHHGFIVIVGPTEELRSCGASGFNPFLGHKLSVLMGENQDQLNEETFEILRRNAFHADGAVVVDSLSGVVAASGWFVSDISKGGKVGGARSRSAKAVAQQAGGCYVIKCSEDSRGRLSLYWGLRSASLEAELQREGEGAQAEGAAALPSAGDAAAAGAFSPRDAI